MHAGMNPGGANTNGEVLNNDFSEWGIDALRIYFSHTDILVHENLFHNQHIDQPRAVVTPPNGVNRHPDCIQGAGNDTFGWWTRVTITENVMLPPRYGFYCQYIFAHNEVGPSMAQVLAGSRCHRDTIIRDNYGQLYHTHGIQISGNKDALIDGNKILYIPNSAHGASGISVMGNNSGTITNNVTANGIKNPGGSVQDDELTISTNVTSNSPTVFPTGWDSTIPNKAGPTPLEGEEEPDDAITVGQWSIGDVVEEPGVPGQFTAVLHIVDTLDYVGFRWSQGVVDVSAGNGTTQVITDLSAIPGFKRVRLTSTDGSHLRAAGIPFTDLRVYRRIVTNGPLTPASDGKDWVETVTPGTGVDIVGGVTVDTSPGDGWTVEEFSISSPLNGRNIDWFVLCPPGKPAGLPMIFSFPGQGSSLRLFQDLPQTLTALKASRSMYMASFDVSKGATGDVAGWGVDALTASWVNNTKLRSHFQFEGLPFITTRYAVHPQKLGLTGFSMGSWIAWYYAALMPTQFNSVSGFSGAYEGYTDGTVGDFLSAVLGTQASQPARYAAISLKNLIGPLTSFPARAVLCGTEDANLNDTQAWETWMNTTGGFTVDVDHNGSSFYGPGGHTSPFFTSTKVALALDWHWDLFEGVVDRPEPLALADWSIHQVIEAPGVPDEYTAQLAIPPTSAGINYVGLRWAASVVDTSAGNGITQTIIERGTLPNGTRIVELTGTGHTVEAEEAFPNLYLYWRRETDGILSAASDSKTFTGPDIPDPEPDPILSLIPAADDWNLLTPVAQSGLVNSYYAPIVFEADGTNTLDDATFTGVQYLFENVGIWTDTIAEGTDSGRIVWRPRPRTPGGSDHTVQFEQTSSPMKVRVITAGGNSQPSADTKTFEGPAAPVVEAPVDPGELIKLGDDFILLSGLPLFIAQNNRPADPTGEIIVTRRNNRVTITPTLPVGGINFIYVYNNQVKSGASARFLIDDDVTEGLVWAINSSGVGSISRPFKIPAAS
jgi:hypothetical protein